MKLRIFSLKLYKTFPSLGVWLALSFLLLNLNVFAADNSFRGFQQCWKYETDKLTNIAPIVTSNSLIFSLSDATLLSVDSITGKVNWKAELGGEIVAPPVSNGNVIISATRTVVDETRKDANSLTVRALTSNTGLTIWQKNFPTNGQVYLVLNGDKLFLAANQAENGVILTNLEIATGASHWSKNLSTTITTKIYHAETQIYFGTKDNSIYSIRSSDGESLKQYKIKYQAQNNLVMTNGIIFFGDSRGRITALRENDSHQLWSLRTGGAVQDILPTPRGLLVTSLDNFVYLHEYSDGERQWRRRLAARPLSAELLNQETAILLANGESSAIVLELKKGKILNQILLGENNYAVASPKVTDKFLFIPTFTGILCFAPDKLACGKTDEPEKEKSAK
ncbi:MAG: PQQ-binding-like beta-propeller repeat protein [Acidobacteriota bacterium]|nr:PQQ-binding-like beta-propeller repeat protein [Acidobacteriota bacterium]